MFQRLKYTLSIIDGELVVSGESIQDDSKNYVPINFAFQYKNYTDKTDKVGKEVRTKNNLISGFLFAYTFR